MANYPPKKNTAYTFYISLVSQADPTIFQANPTIAAGDFKVSIDGGALNNLGTTPSAAPASSKIVKIDLSAAEMNGDDIVVLASDAAGTEWNDWYNHIKTTTRNLDDLAFPTTSGRSIDVTATGAVGIDWANVEAPTTVVGLSGTTIKTATDVETDTAVIGALGAGLTAIPWNAAWDAEVESEANDALVAQNLDHLVKIAVDTNFATTVHLDSVVGQLADDGTLATFDRTTDSIEAIRNTAPLGTAMRGTDSAALASVCTEARLAELDAANLPTTTDAILADTGTDGVVVAAASKTGYSIVAGGIGSGAHAAAELNAIADGVLDRNMATGTDSGTDSTVTRTVRQALRPARNKATIAGGVLTVKKEDDTTTSWTAAITTTAGNPISESDPT